MFHDLNTSHVKVNPMNILSFYLIHFNLNTSHVKVNHGYGDFTGRVRTFKYISC